MKIECEKTEHISYSTKCEVKKYCCKKMEHAMNCVRDYGRTMRTERGGIKLSFVQRDDYSSSKTIEPTSGLISFCPFCGERIE